MIFADFNFFIDNDEDSSRGEPGPEPTPIE